MVMGKIRISVKSCREIVVDSTEKECNETQEVNYIQSDPKRINSLVPFFNILILVTLYKFHIVIIISYTK